MYKTRKSSNIDTALTQIKDSLWSGGRFSIINKQYRYVTKGSFGKVIESFHAVDADGNSIRRPMYNVDTSKTTFFDDVFRWFMTPKMYMRYSWNIFINRAELSSIPLRNLPITSADNGVYFRIEVIDTIVYSEAHRELIIRQHGAKNVQFALKKHIPTVEFKNMIIHCGNHTSLQETATITKTSQTTENSNKPGSAKSYKQQDNIDIDFGDDDDAAPAVRVTNTASNNTSKYLAYGYKIADLASGEKCIVKLGISKSKHTRMNKSAKSDGKIRVNKAHVLAICKVERGYTSPASGRVVFTRKSAKSFHDKSFTYTTGSKVSVANYDNSSNECSAGIHFFFDPIAALRFYGSKLHQEVDTIENLEELIDADFYTNPKPTKKRESADMSAPAIEDFEYAPLPTALVPVTMDDEPVIILNEHRYRVNLDEESIIWAIARESRRRKTLNDVSRSLYALDLELKQFT
jgi:hypothetical protein